MPVGLEEAQTCIVALQRRTCVISTLLLGWMAVAWQLKRYKEEKIFELRAL